MILEGANKLKEESSYTIYAMNSATAGQYCAIIPNSANDTLNMLIDLHEKKLFDEVSSGVKTKDDLTNVLEKEYEQIKSKYPYGILIVPMIKEEEYSNAVNTLDKQKMFDETKKIGAITSELYKKLTESGVEKQKINQKIIMIEQNEVDAKYVNWLKEQMPNYVEGISLEEKKEEVIASANSENNIFGMPKIEATPEPQVKEDTPSQDIFSSVTPQTAPPIQPEPSQPIVSPTIETPVPKENVDIFGIPANQPAAAVENSVQQPTPAVEVTPEPTVEQQTPTPMPTVEPTPEAPKAVQNIELEGTTTFSPLPNNPQESVENNNASSTDTSKKSNGFVNLAILLVVLIGVTIVSIELGKFLYSVYGA